VGCILLLPPASLGLGICNVIGGVLWCGFPTRLVVVRCALRAGCSGRWLLCLEPLVCV
jgi:hypothetical protein